VVLNPQWVFGLAQNVQQVIIRKEEEAGKCKSFSVQIVVQTLLDTVNLVIVLLQVLKKPCL
jgi:uncharacterized protein (DUF2235 family)